jgi:natural product precursor
MKKDRKKLGLNRETLRHLSGRELRPVHGGGDTTVRCVEASECQCVSEGGGCVTTTEICPSGGTITSAWCTTGAYC